MHNMTDQEIELFEVIRNAPYAATVNQEYLNSTLDYDCEHVVGYLNHRQLIRREGDEYVLW